jgi:hypothetical protein
LAWSWNYLLKNTWRPWPKLNKVLLDENERCKEKLVRNSLFESNHFFMTVCGGKTGMSVIMPVDLAICLTNYYILKNELCIVNDKTGKKQLKQSVGAWVWYNFKLRKTVM